MLYNFFISFKFHRFSQSGCYFDFFLKKISDVFVRNVFVYVSQFFGEKYMIEVLTKNIIDSCIFTVNKKIGWTTLSYFNFFFQFLIILFYSVGIFNLFFIIL